MDVNSNVYIDPRVVAATCPHEEEVRRRDPAIVDVTQAICELSFDKIGGKVLVIYTGGTLGMKKDGDGSYTPVKGYLTELLKTLPEFQPHSNLNQGQLPEYDVIEWDPLLDSSDLDPDHWIKIATQIGEHYDNYKGFVVLHGTDTMAYTASALSYLLESLGKTVVITGSMIPMILPYNDARRNFIVSLLVASQSNIPEVCIYFSDCLIRGNRSRKVDAWGVNAFQSSFPNLGHLGGTLQIRRDLVLPFPRDAFKVHKEMCRDIIVLRLIPGMYKIFLQSISELKPLKGLVIEAFGTGTASTHEHSHLFEMIKRCIDNDVVVVVTSQCHNGGVDLMAYANGVKLKKLGVVSGYDMTTEAAVAKLGYLLSKNYPLNEIRKLMEIPLRGELTNHSYTVVPSITVNNWRPLQ